jgi:hypothetical protein
MAALVVDGQCGDVAGKRPKFPSKVSAYDKLVRITHSGSRLRGLDSLSSIFGPI